MALVVGTNSYVTYAEAEAYMSNRLFVVAWDGAGQQTCEKALMMATKRIDALMLSGAKTASAQVLQFPRRGTISVPQGVKDAVCEEALAILAGGEDGNARADLQAAGVTSFNIGGMSETLKEGTGLLSSAALGLIAPYMGVGEIA